MPTIGESLPATLPPKLEALLVQAARDVAAESDARVAAELERDRPWVARDVREWQHFQRPTHLDITWSRYRDFERLVCERPFPVRHPGKPWNARNARPRTRKAQVSDAAMSLTPIAPTDRSRVTW